MVLHAAIFPREFLYVIKDHIDVYVAPSYFTRQDEEGDGFKGSFCNTTRS